MRFKDTPDRRPRRSCQRTRPGCRPARASRRPAPVAGGDRERVLRRDRCSHPRGADDAGPRPRDAQGRRCRLASTVTLEANERHDRVPAASPGLGAGPRLAIDAALVCAAPSARPLPGRSPSHWPIRRLCTSCSGPTGRSSPTSGTARPSGRQAAQPWVIPAGTYRLVLDDTSETDMDFDLLGAGREAGHEHVPRRGGLGRLSSRPSSPAPPTPSATTATRQSSGRSRPRPDVLPALRDDDHDLLELHEDRGTGNRPRRRRRVTGRSPHRGSLAAAVSAAGKARSRGSRGKADGVARRPGGYTVTVGGQEHEERLHPSSVCASRGGSR